MSGTLIQQLVDYANHTAQDRLIEMVLQPNANLTDDNKAYLFGPGPGGNLFDINGQFLVDTPHGNLHSGLLQGIVYRPGNFLRVSILGPKQDQGFSFWHCHLLL